MNTSFTHVLSLKVWNQITHTTTDYANIQNKVKSELLKREKEQGWFEFKHDGTFSLGDLAIQWREYSDTEVVQRVCKFMFDLNNELHTNGILSEHQRIIFQLVKPLVTEIAY